MPLSARHFARTGTSAVLAALLSFGMPASPAPAHSTTPPAALERQALPAGDGWASAEGGTTGGAAAASNAVIDVRTRDQLAAAVAGDEPKIVRVVRDIRAARSCTGYARDGYTLAGYLDAFDPAHWTGPARGPLEDARKASSAAQREQIQIDVGANTTLIGVGEVQLTGFSVNIANVDNVIVRNLRISDAYDCFPVWDGGTWKSEWDNVVVSGATHVWLDHLTLDDGRTEDADQPEYFGQKFLRHDGLLDVVRQADLVTISWSRLRGHDKALLWGNGDGVVADSGKLRVTMHHNELTDLVQRGPRVRFGQVHVYNNTYVVRDAETYQYSWGVGVEASIHARANSFQLADGISADRIIRDWGGTGIVAARNWVNGAELDILAAYNQAHPEKPVAGTVSGSAGPHRTIQPAPTARATVAAWAGAGRLHRAGGTQDPTDPAQAGSRLLRQLGAPRTETADGPVWSPVATGFASTPSADLPEGTTGGTGGRTVVVSDAAALARYAASSEPLTILVRGELEVEPFGSMVNVASNKTIVGIGRRPALVGGGLFLDRVSNVIVRNLTFRDSYVPGDWDGKSADNDNDGIRLDTSSHVWIDHNEFARLGDGLVDVRKDSTAVTLSWNRFLDHNKAIGVGWTTNVVTTITLHHNWFANTYQRNASVDNVAAGHLYNNYLDGFGHYGTMSRGAAQLVVESSVYASGEDPIVAKDADSKVDSRNNEFAGVRGRRDHTGPTFDPARFYAYQADPVGDVRTIVPASAGPLAASQDVGRRVRVALDGTGDFASVGAAAGAAGRSGHPVEIVVAPGSYREVVRLFPGADRLTIRGATGDPRDVVLTYDIAAGQQKFYGGTFGSSGSATLSVLASDLTLRDLTIRNDYDEAANGGSQALALRTTGDRIVLDGVRLIGNQDTYLADSPSRDVRSRVYAKDAYVEGDVDFIYGRATAVFANSTIRSLDRGATVNGYVTAASTVTGNPYGFLFTGCRFVSDAAPGSVFLGRPWHPSSDPNTDPAVVVRDSWLGAHIGTPAWTDMSGWSWRDAEFFEYANTGPGAATGDGRPHLTDEQAAGVTPAAYLGGSDGWSPWRR